MFLNRLRAVSCLRRFSSSSNSMSTHEKYWFDCNGYIVLKNVFSKEEIAAANEAVDRNSDRMLERTKALRNTVKGSPLQGDGKTGRRDLGGLLGWEGTDSSIFRSVLAHHRLIPYLHEIVGEGYRLDHHPLLIQQIQGSEGFMLHGGPLNPDGNWNPNLAYSFNFGKIFAPLLAVSVQLTDVNKGDGGFCIIKGSHKANYPCPPEISHCYDDTDALEHAYQPSTEAGDVILFTEATTHGTLPWVADRTRRAVLYRFAPHNIAYSRSFADPWPESYLEGMTDIQKAVMEPPYALRLDRPTLENDGSGLSVAGRGAEKKAFDRKVFGTKYF